MTILALGGIIHEIKMPDRKGCIDNIVHGFENVMDYKRNDAYFGALIGRTAGRIYKGQFELNGVHYQMPIVDRGNGLHGGLNGLDKKYFNVVQENNRLILTTRFLDGEEGFPGNVDVKIIYTLKEDALILEYQGITDQDTLLNMTNHTYFNLDPSKSVLDMKLQVDASYILEIDDVSIPTGQTLEVVHTPFDFRQSKFIGKDIDSNHEQLKKAGGYDHPWLLDGDVILSSENGRKIVMTSNQPCVVLYSYNFPLEGHKKYQGLAVEFQQEPNGIHHQHFNQGILRKGDTYNQRTVYRFMVE